MKIFTLSPQVFVFVALSEAAALAVADDPHGRLVAVGGVGIALLMAFFAYQRDRRDRRAERQRQDQQHDDNLRAQHDLKAVVDEIHRDIHREDGLLAKEKLNRALRHDRPGERQHDLLRFAHDEQWMEDAARCTELPLPPFRPLPLPTPPQRRHDDVG